MILCAFCNRQSYAGFYTRPPMCEKHFDLVLIGERLAREGKFVSATTLIQAYRELPSESRAGLHLTEEVIPGLFAEIREKNFSFNRPKEGAR